MSHSSTPTDESSTDSSAQANQTQSNLTDHRESVTDADTRTRANENQSSEFAVPDGVDLSTLLMSTAELDEARTLPYHTAEELIENPSVDDPQFTGTLAYETLAVLAKHLVGIASESRVAITTDGWYISVVNPSNVAMVSAWLPATDWAAYECDREGVIGLSWDGGGGSVSRALKHFSRGAAVEIALDDRTIAFDDGIPIEFATFDPDSARQTPEMPDLVLPNSCVLPGVDLDELTKRMDDIAAHFSIVGLPATNGVELVAEGESAVVCKEYQEFADLTVFDGSRKHNVFDTHVVDSDRSVFSLDYIREFLSKPRKSDLRTGYKLRFGSEFPVKIERQLGDEGFLRYLQAPRIEST
jgi:DNA polymerase III sliding clamp (beta) subunit (PCNA family)